MRPRNLSIKQKLTAMVMGVSLTAVLVTVLAICAYLAYDIRRSKQQELEISAAVAGDRNSAALSFLDAKRAEANLEIFHLDAAMQAACVYDGTGQLFAGYARSGQPACPQQVKEVHGIEIPGTLQAFQGVGEQGKPLGSVYLRTDTRAIDAYIRKITLISSSVVAIVLAATLLMTIYIQRGITNPIRELAGVARQVSQNRNFSAKVRVHQQDEIGQLAQAFNDMLAEVRQRDQELMYANETLEHKVLLRTRQLDDARRTAEAANEAKSEFLRNISHEFRTPLHAMISFSSYGIKEAEIATREDQKRYFQIIQKSSERLSRLVNEVLDVARFEQGEQVFTIARADMHELVSRSLEAVRPLLQEKQIRVVQEHASERAALTCDHDRIVQVITNLLSNAVKFSPPETTITLRSGVLEASEPSVFVSCVDQGVGIPEREKQLIFEPFRQSSTTKTGAGGTGLGLAICRGIIEAHGGHIWAENNPAGHGTTFTFTMPSTMPEGRLHIRQNTMEASHENAA